MDNNIKRFREERDMTQYQLAKKAGMTRRGILQIETHKRDPRLSNAYRIAKALNKDIDEVFVLE